MVDVEVWVSAPLPVDAVPRDWLTDVELERVAQKRLPADRERLVTGRALVRAALADVLGVAPQDVPIVVAPRTSATPGRPSSPGGPSFSIAHSADVVLVAVSGTGSVGVDVEHESAVAVAVADADADDLASLETAVHPRERPAVGWTAASFTRDWVRREAVLKAVGTGLLAPRDDLLLDAADAGARVRETRGTLPGVNTLALLDLTDDVGAALAATGAPTGMHAAVAIHHEQHAPAVPLRITALVRHASTLLRTHRIRPRPHCAGPPAP